MSSNEFQHNAMDTSYSPSSVKSPASNHVATAPPHTKRSDVLRHVFPRSHLIHNSSVIPNNTSRMMRLSHKGSQHASQARHSRPRVAFQRALVSFFNSSPDERITPASNVPMVSTSSSVHSRANSNSVHGSMPSLEFVSSGHFIFSSPSLKSRSGSHSNSTSRLPSLNEVERDLNGLRYVHSNPFSYEDIYVG